MELGTNLFCHASSQATVIRRCQFISDYGSLVFVFNVEYCSVNLRCVPRVGTEQSAREEMVHSLRKNNTVQHVPWMKKALCSKMEANLPYSGIFVVFIAWA